MDAADYCLHDDVLTSLLQGSLYMTASQSILGIQVTDRRMSLQRH